MLRLPGLGPDSAIGRWVDRVNAGRPSRRGVRIAGFSAALAAGLGVVLVIFAAQLSSTPSFCGTCHIMKPYYESWKHSKHSRIACVECHIAPGITSEIRKKYEALSMVVKYFTATYGTNPWAQVEDAACLRCHERRLLEGKEVFHNVLFDHRPHLTESRRGLKLRCTSCHSQIVQGSHISVTSSTCALCHFKNQQINAGTGRCQNCHQIPERVLTTAGTAFDHSEVRRLDMDCRSCHAGVVRGDGAVPRERCVTCHNQVDRLARYGERDYLHRMHVSEHKINCMNCHLEIQHGNPEHPLVADAGGCGSCHGDGHSPQRDLYAGVGGRGVPRMPGPMATAGVSCEGCHNPSVSVAAAGTDAPLGGHTLKASEVSCMSCHGPGYRRIFFAWKEGVATRLAALDAQLSASVAAMGAEPPAAWQDARFNAGLVERGKGVHNVNYAYALLEKAHEQMNQARRARGLGPLALPWTAVAKGSAAAKCLGCHTGIERQAGTFGGRPYAHAPHLAAKLDCATCHRPHAERAPGEIVRFGANGCVPCHHRTAEVDAPKCMGCHGDVTARTVTSFRGEFSHKGHLEQGLECGTCHAIKNGDPRPAKETCAQCHEGG